MIRIRTGLESRPAIDNVQRADDVFLTMVLLTVTTAAAGGMATIRTSTEVGRAIQFFESRAATDTDTPPARSLAARRTDDRRGPRDHRRPRAAT